MQIKDLMYLYIHKFCLFPSAKVGPWNTDKFFEMPLSKVSFGGGHIRILIQDN